MWTVSKIDYGYAVAPMTRPPPPLDFYVGLSAVVFLSDRMFIYLYLLLQIKVLPLFFYLRLFV